MILNVQALRALAAYLVVLVHLQGLWGNSNGGRLLDFGHFGVDLFFIISGFIMVYTTGSRHSTPAKFAVGRILRVVPLYWLSTLAVFGVALAAPMLLQATRADPIELIKSLSFFPYQKSNGLVQPIVFLGWTLNYEMFFYLLFTLSLFVKNRLVGLGSLVAFLAALVFGGFLLEPTGLVARFYTDSILAEFAFGIIIGTFYTKITMARHLVPHSIAAILISVILIVLAPSLWQGVPRVFAFGVPAAFVVAAALNLEGSGLILRNSFVQFLGSASYAIYLTHFFITQLFVKLAARFHVSSIAMIAGLVLLTILTVTLLGALTHVLVERRLTRWAKRILTWGRDVRAARTGLPLPQDSTV